MAPPSEDATAIAARLDGAVALDLEVVETYDVAKGILELTLEGDLSGFSPWPGQDVMIAVPPGDDQARWRRYTVRRFDPTSSTIDLWVTVDTDGPGATWASNAATGDRVDAVGPRGKIALDTDATSHLFVVDLSGVAAMCAMAEALEAPALVATVALMAPVSGYEDSDAIAPACVEDVVLRHHVLHDDNAPWTAKVLEATISQLDVEATAAYVFGELAGERDFTYRIAVTRLRPFARACSNAKPPMRVEAADSK